MNENENDKKPEEGEAAAPATEETAQPYTAPEADMASGFPPETESDPQPAPEPAADAASEDAPEPALYAANVEPTEPGTSAAANAEPEPASEPELEAGPVAAMFQDPPAEPKATPEPEPAPESEPTRSAPWWSATRSSDLRPEPEAPAEPVAAESDDNNAVEATAAAAVIAAAAGASEPEPEPEPAPAPEPEPESEPLPLRIYEYRFIRVKQNTWDSVEAAILSTGAAAVADAGGQLYGVWAGQIGLSANQGIVVTVWTELQAAKRNGDAAIKGIADISASEALYLEPTARPLDATAPEGPGMFAHRVFEVRRDDAERFIELSDKAWPQFEEVFGAKIFALWRETGHERAYDRLVLLTRYPDYDGWEKSRYWRPEPDPNAADALQGFRERREVTVDTVVYTTRLATAQS